MRGTVQESVTASDFVGDSTRMSRGGNGCSAWAAGRGIPKRTTAPIRQGIAGACLILNPPVRPHYRFEEGRDQELADRPTAVPDAGSTGWTARSARGEPGRIGGSGRRS